MLKNSLFWVVGLAVFGFAVFGLDAAFNLGLFSEKDSPQEVADNGDTLDEKIAAAVAAAMREQGQGANTPRDVSVNSVDRNARPGKVIYVSSPAAPGVKLNERTAVFAECLQEKGVPYSIVDKGTHNDVRVVDDELSAGQSVIVASCAAGLPRR
ncbi:hypothetical protein JXR01_00170 [Candidatus Kaiserbacteria bacterium]|nr:MAG: hypothetical protein JXR01_00170 [Candidatus Kaiserbacteria bacterium]